MRRSSNRFQRATRKTKAGDRPRKSDQHPYGRTQNSATLLEKLNTIVSSVQQAGDISQISEDITQLKHISEDFLDAEKHYLREENVLFPILEKHGIREPPAIMWMEHNQLRDKKKQLHNLIEISLKNTIP